MKFDYTDLPTIDRKICQNHTTTEIIFFEPCFKNSISFYSPANDAFLEI